MGDIGFIIMNKYCTEIFRAKYDKLFEQNKLIKDTKLLILHQ